MNPYPNIHALAAQLRKFTITEMLLEDRNPKAPQITGGEKFWNQIEKIFNNCH